MIDKAEMKDIEQLSEEVCAILEKHVTNLDKLDELCAFVQNSVQVARNYNDLAHPEELRYVGEMADVMEKALDKSLVEKHLRNTSITVEEGEGWKAFHVKPTSVGVLLNWGVIAGIEWQKRQK